ncbi:hypothetical protein B0H14DRAFT_3717388 [Mycena olivaceomarginata]|nr:hypothetical protein B0H14DRAFT_3717388 [Mycena olivaceomarginata]
MDPSDAPAASLICSQSKCKTVLPPNYKWGSYQGTSKRARTEPATENVQPELPHLNPNLEALRSKRVGESDESSTDEGSNAGPMMFANQQALFSALRKMFKTTKHIEFHGSYNIPEDPLVTDKERVKMTNLEIWKVTGYRFRVKENKLQKTGHKTRFYCCQDSDRKQKSRKSQREGAKARDTLGMRRYTCKSNLRVSCLAGAQGFRKVTVRLHHHDAHVPCYDVAMPEEAAAIIREGIQHHTPVEMVGKVQGLFPQVTASQVHSAWSAMSEVLWKRDDLQLPSAEKLLQEFGDDVDVFDVHPAEGVDQLCWAMPKIAEPLRGKIVEIGLDATL